MLAEALASGPQCPDCTPYHFDPHAPNRSVSAQNSPFFTPFHNLPRQAPQEPRTARLARWGHALHPSPDQPTPWGSYAGALPRLDHSIPRSPLLMTRTGSGQAPWSAPRSPLLMTHLPPNEKSPRRGALTLRLEGAPYPYMLW